MCSSSKLSFSASLLFCEYNLCNLKIISEVHYQLVGSSKFVSRLTFIVRPVGIHSRILILSALHADRVTPSSPMVVTSSLGGMPTLTPWFVRPPQMFILHLFDTHNSFFVFTDCDVINEQTCHDIPGFLLDNIQSLVA